MVSAQEPALHTVQERQRLLLLCHAAAWLLSPFIPCPSYGHHTYCGHAVSLAVVPNLPLGATRVGELPMWKGCATASATRAAIFAAQLAQQGMTGPAEPFEGRRGLWEQAPGKPVALEKFGGSGAPAKSAGAF